MTAVPAVFVDTNALYSTALRDIFIELAAAGVIRLYWSQTVIDELNTAILKQRPQTPVHRIATRTAAMNYTLPTAMVVPNPERKLKATLPDPKDAHVLAAALDAGCSLIITFNLRDFPTAELQRESVPIRAVHPDEFLVTLLTTNATPVLKIIQDVAKKLNKPPMPWPDYLASLVKSELRQTAALLQYLVPPPSS